ncbi:FAD-dependent oxidoreductase [Bradyrhizobium sp. BR 10289]|uniref:NAD(P)/FAD-dependent oxidoreductase n=1 Tax=Bradyrhizobium sp. BR 10289 TaxID=2749993 RepID=UPI001C6518D1|nr:FAD-dependent oxidoreductase [Bradyrhizobium sp. BR 10289]MBW7970542.1 FAD-binding oxidoreductase [Bradyrhizobium sp. BR 10289]
MIETDVLVIGAGFTGLSAALKLRHEGVSVSIVEAGQPGAGASGRNSGLVIPMLSRSDPDDIVQRYGASGERFVALLRDCADDLFATATALRLGKQAEQNGWLQPAHTPGRMALIAQRAAQWSKWGAAVEVVDRLEARDMLGSEMWFGGLLCRSGGAVNPLALVQAMAEEVRRIGGNIYAQTPALSFTRRANAWQVATPLGEVRARSLIIATNAYTAAASKALLPGVAREIVPVTSWLAATDPLPEAIRCSVLPTRLAMSDTRGDLHFARYDVNDRLISGGRSSIRSTVQPGFESWFNSGSRGFGRKFAASASGSSGMDGSE